MWLKTGWGAFGWLEVRFASPVYAVLTAITVAVALVTLAGLWRARRTVDRAVVLFFAVVGAVLLLGLHWTEYRLLRSGAGPFNVGRYLFPTRGPRRPGGRATVRTLRPALRPAGAATALSGLLLLNLYRAGAHGGALLCVARASSCSCRGRRLVVLALLAVSHRRRWRSRSA